MENLKAVIMSVSEKRTKFGRFFRMMRLFNQLNSGCKMVALLGGRRPRLPSGAGHVRTATLFGYRKCRVILAIQDDPRCEPSFVIELPLHTSALLKEMETGLVRIALESESSRSMQEKKSKTRRIHDLLDEELVWGVYFNGRKTGCSVKMEKTRMTTSEEEEQRVVVEHVMQLLHGVSMGAGVLPTCHLQLPEQKKKKEEAVDVGELTYMRAPFHRVIGSKDSQAFYMINPDATAGPGPDLTIFFLRN